jgi:hypothetical protein
VQGTVLGDGQEGDRPAPADPAPRRDPAPPDSAAHTATHDAPYGATHNGTRFARVNGHHPRPAASGSLQDSLTPTVGTAVLIASLIASAQGKVVGTNLLLTAFALAGSPALRAALSAQGPVGDAAFARLASQTRISDRHLSPRVQSALHRAGAAPGLGATTVGQAGDAAVLRELLTDFQSTARQLLSTLNVDPDEVLRSLTGGSG